MKTFGINAHRTDKSGAVERAWPSRATFLTAMLSLILGLGPVWAQKPVPDLNGIWGRDAHNYPKPFLAPGRAGGVKDGYNNEYLRPWVVELLQRDDLVTASGHGIVTSHTVCYPEGVPYAFGGGGSIIQILQMPTEITMIFSDHSQWRTIRMNVPHANPVKPSWWGDAVGHFEGDTLVIDTVGVAVNPESGSMGDFGVPHTLALHLVEHWRFLSDGEKSMAPTPHDDIFAVDDVIKGGKVMRLAFTVEDSIAYRKPWSATLDYLALKPPIKEFACAENNRNLDLAPLLPTAAIPDF